MGLFCTHLYVDGTVDSGVVLYTFLCRLDSRQCPDKGCVLISEVLDRDILLYEYCYIVHY